MFSSICILIAAWYAGSYPKRKDKIDMKNKALRICGHIKAMERKLKYIRTSINEKDDRGEYRDRYHGKFIESTRLIEDINFLIDYEEYIYALMSDEIDVAGLITDLQVIAHNLGVDHSKKDLSYYTSYIEIQNTYLASVLEKLKLIYEGILPRAKQHSDSRKKSLKGKELNGNSK